MTQQSSEINRPVTRAQAHDIQESGICTTVLEKRLATELINRIQQIDRLQLALHKCDKWHSVLEDLFEDAYLDTHDMEEIP